MYNEYADISIQGIIAAVPDNFVENAKYEEYIELRVLSRQSKLTGIQSRYLSFENQGLSDLLLPAAKQLMENRNIGSEDIKAVVVVTETPDYIAPATACYIQKQLLIPEDAICIDVNQGCAGAAVGMQLICSLLEGTDVGTKGLLCIGNYERDFKKPEKMDQRTILDNMIYGSGVAVLEFEVVEQECRIACETLSYGKYMENVYRKNDGTVLNNALKVVDFNHDIFAKGISGFKELVAISDTDIDFYLLNQSQKMIMNTIFKSAGLEEDKILLSVQKFGDTYSAAPFITLCYEREKLRKMKNNILLAVSGSGMTCGYSWFCVDFDKVFDLLYIKE